MCKRQAYSHLQYLQCSKTSSTGAAVTVISLCLADHTELDAAADAEQRRRHVIERQRQIDSITGASATQTQEGHAHHRFDVTDPSSLRQP